MDPITKAFVASMERFSRELEIPVVQFRKGQRKDDVMKEHLAQFGKPEGVVFIGKAQEKDPGVPHGKAPQSADGTELSLDCALVGDGEPLLLLLSGPGLRPLLPQVLFLLPL